MSRLPCGLLCAAVLLGVTGCEREARRFSSPAANETPQPMAPRTSGLQPGEPLTAGVKLAARNESPYEASAWGAAQGKRLYGWYNCAGCHANGGGGIGPALMDREWRYGSEPAQIFESIMRGRPNGMPSFGGHIPEDQAWQIVAYVRSMSGQLRKDVAPSRSDRLYPGNPENARPREDSAPEQREKRP